MNRRTVLIYGVLVVAWATIVVWQMAEHSRVRTSARVALINRAKDISNTLGVVTRSQRRFGGMISKDRLELALKELIKPGEVDAIALLNAAHEVVASAGATDFRQGQLPSASGELWTDQSVSLMNLVDLGTNVTQEAGENRPTIILPTREMFPRGDTNRSGFGPLPAPADFSEGSRSSDTNAARFPRSGSRPPRNWGPDENRERESREGGRRPFGRPFWMSEAEYQSLIQKKGVHSFVIVMSTEPILAIYRNDLWLRSVISILALASVVGFGVAWRTMTRSSVLELRLVRASELNSHLKQMNLAAAGLAHETRNPLNIIRGLAQLISKQEEASPETRSKSRDIINETDRVTAQLNEFINYSRPREVRRSAVPLDAVVAEVTRALSYDLEEKQIRIEVHLEPLTIEADEQLLRQALFNLVLNAIQAVEAGGRIYIRGGKRNGAGAYLEIADNGPGVRAEHRAEIFKPYFTTHQKGTGLGLAVVQQIVLAHGWEIECLNQEPRGAVFRIVHLKLAARN